MRNLAFGMVALCCLALGCSTEPARSHADQGGSSNGPTAGASQVGGSSPAGGSAAGSSATVGGAAGGKPSSGAAGDGGTAGLPAQGGEAGDPGGLAQLPAEALDLSNWKLTLPTGDAESPTEIKQPQLASFEMAPYFYFDAATQAVVFRAHAGGVTTSGSGYPRCELREMTNAGVDNAAWSMTSGTHSMTIRQAITHLPLVKPHVVAGQIHDAEDDVVMIRLEGEHLFVEGGGEELGDLTPSYQLGSEFTVRIVASEGVISVYYDDLVTPKVELQSEASDCYFKAGAYTQSSPERGDEPTAYGEVAIYALEVTHE